LRGDNKLSEDACETGNRICDTGVDHRLTRG